MSAPTKTYVLDANALLNFAEGGPGFRKVEELLLAARRQQSVLFVSVLNLGEVLYLLWQRHGEEEAHNGVARLSRLPLYIVPVSVEQAMKAGELKALHKIPYVDCITAALAVERRAAVVTTDRDFEKLGRQFPVLWLPRT